MSSEVFALVVAIGVPLILRIFDYFLPEGRYFKLVRKYTTEDDDDEEEEEE